jgi:hypothetical protein
MLNRDKPPAGADLQVSEFKRAYPKAVHRPVGPTNAYNCHGLTFGSRRTVIWKPSEVQKILQEDDYVEVLTNMEIFPGDIAIYSKDGDIEHSGVVVEVFNRRPKILSKWGMCQEVVHFVEDCPYKESSVRYFRVKE